MVRREPGRGGLVYARLSYMATRVHPDAIETDDGRT